MWHIRVKNSLERYIFERTFVSILMSSWFSKSFPCWDFGEKINLLLWGAYVINLESHEVDKLSNEMTLNLYVFSSSVEMGFMASMMAKWLLHWIVYEIFLQYLRLLMWILLEIVLISSCFTNKASLAPWFSTLNSILVKLSEAES